MSQKLHRSKFDKHQLQRSILKKLKKYPKLYTYLRLSFYVLKHPIASRAQVRRFTLNKIRRHQKIYVSLKLCFWGLKRPLLLFDTLVNKDIPHSPLIIVSLLKYGGLNIASSETPEVSIIIPTHNHIDYTYQCLKSIEIYTSNISYEVIIADDASTNKTVAFLSNMNNIRLIRNTKSLGFLKNCNNAAKEARGKYLVFLNNDIEVTDNWLSSLLDLAKSDPSIGLVGSKMIFPDGQLQEAGGIITREGVACNYGKYDDARSSVYNYVRDADYISGASILISKSLWDSIGGFDESYAPAYCEDSDLAFTVRSLGYRVVYQPKSVVIHYEGISHGTNAKAKNSIKHYQLKNSIKLKEKWAESFKQLPSKKTNKLDFSFRDRIGNKKVVLVIDQYAPEFDKDAGSKTTYQYLKLLVQKGFLVKFLPDNFYNNGVYTEILEQMGIEVLYGEWYANNWKKWVKINAHNIDVIYLNRPNISIKYLRFLRENTNAKLIYYGHDLHFLREHREYELTGDIEHEKSSKKIRKTEFDIMRQVDVVYYPSIIEKRIINGVDRTINVKKINAYMYDNINEKKYDFSRRDGLMFVGGFNHKPNVDAILWFTKYVYPIIRQSKNIQFFIAGSNPPESIQSLTKTPGINVLGKITDDELYELYKKTKLVVVPLRYGAGIKGKVVEALSNGSVLVTTSVGAEGINNLKSIVPVCDTPEKFAEAVLNLYDKDDKLCQISVQERNYIKEHFSSECAWKIIKNDFLTKRNVRKEVKKA